MKRELGRGGHGRRTASRCRRVVVHGFHQHRRAFPIGLLTGLVCAAVWLGAVGTSAQAQGVSGYSEVTGAAVTAPGFTSATGAATCPAGDVVVSGGYTLVGGAAAAVRGTVGSSADRCDATLVHVTHGTVVVSDLVRHKSITVRAGHSYLALARPPKHK